MFVYLSFLLVPVADTTYSTEVHTSVGHPTTLLLDVPDVMEENVIWVKDGQQCTRYTVLKDGSLYISHTELSDQGEYTVMVTKDGDTSSETYTVLVVDPEMPQGLLLCIKRNLLYTDFQTSESVTQSLKLKIFQNTCRC